MLIGQEIKEDTEGTLKAMFGCPGQSPSIALSSADVTHLPYPN